MKLKTALAALLAATLTALSCTDSLEETPVPDQGDKPAMVKLTVVPSIKGAAPDTKSSISSGEEYVKNINIYFYHEGQLVTSGYYTLPSVVTFLLNEGMEFNVYAIANAGEVTAEDKEEDFLKYRYSIDSRGYVGQINSDGFPLVWKKEGYIVEKASPQMSISLTRLVSKIRFSVEKDALAGLRITSVRLLNGAGSITPFQDNGHGGSKVTSASQTVDGDYASASDLSTLNSGGQVCFYVMENCQGTLLSGNKDPWEKTPDNIDVADLCTYLEVGCEFQSGFALKGTITYRVYLGQDNCTNFDIIRNVDMGVKLCLTKNLDNVSWKIDPDVDYNGSLGSIWVEEGLHGTDDLYVGETVLLGLSVNKYLEDYLGKGLEGCSIKVTRNGEDCSNFSLGKLSYNASSYHCEVTCKEETGDDIFEVWLAGPDGKIITDLTLDDGDLVCSLPIMKIGDGNKYRPGETIRDRDYYITPFVNGAHDIVSIYLTDKAGNNLNVSDEWGQYDFDLTYFKNQAMTAAPTSRAIAKAASGSGVFASAYSVSFTSGDKMDDGPSFNAAVTMNNPGTSAILCRTLSNLYHLQSDHLGLNALAELTFETTNTVSTKATADFELVKPKFYLADKGTFPSSSGYSFTGATFIAAYNPSKIDFWADVIYVGRRKGSTTSSIIDGTKLVNFRSGSSAPSYYIPIAARVSAYPYIADCSSALLQYTSSSAKNVVIEGKDCKVFSTDNIGSVAKLSETDGNKAYMRAEVGIRTLGGKSISYDHDDLNGSFLTSAGTITTNAAYGYTWGDDTYSYRGSGWHSGDGMTEVIDANNDAYVSSASGYSGSNAYNLMMRKPVEFSIYWDSSIKTPVVSMTGNTFGASFKVYVGLVFKSSCTTANNTSSSSSTHTYTVNVPEKATTVPSYYYSLSGESDSVNLPNYVTLESNFANINRSYWHENCTNAINLKSNRFSQMAMPQSAEYCISIAVEDKDLWVPVNVTITNPSASITTSSIYSFYSKTDRGTYADTSSMTNPDGSSRGSDSNVSSQAQKYSEYTKASGTYTVSFSVLHNMYWNWYQM